MPNYAYIAIDANTGREKRGVVAGSSQSSVTTELKEQGLYPTQVELDSSKSGPTKKTATKNSVEQPTTKTPRGESWFDSSSVTAKDLTLFTRQFATLVRAGMPLLRGLEVIARQQKSVRFKSIVEGLAETIRTGGSLSDGMAQNPRIFNRLYLNMVKAGEASGALDSVLLRLAEFLEKSQRIRGKVKTAMTYPLIIMGVALGVVGALIVFVIPRFESIFKTMLKGQPLPGLTRTVLGVSEFLQHNLLVSAGLIGLGVVAFRLLLKTPQGARIRDRILLVIPVGGDLVLKAAVSRFTRTLGTLLASGVQILEALQITRDTAGNIHVAEAVDTVQTRVKAGEGIARPLEETKVFPAMVASMIEVGEETGKLPDMLERIADTYEEEVDNAVNALTSILEPVMIVLMAVVVGTIVIALFLPLVRIIQTLS